MRSATVRDRARDRDQAALSQAADGGRSETRRSASTSDTLVDPDLLVVEIDSTNHPNHGEGRDEKRHHAASLFDGSARPALDQAAVVVNHPTGMTECHHPPGRSRSLTAFGLVDPPAKMSSQRPIIGCTAELGREAGDDEGREEDRKKTLCGGSEGDGLALSGDEGLNRLEFPRLRT